MTLALLNRYKVTFSGVAVGTATELTVQFPVALASKDVVVHQFLQSITSGSATTHAPQLGQVATFVANSLDQRYEASEATLPDMVNDVPLITLTLDASARAYVRPAVDTGSNNVVAGEIRYEVVNS